MPYSTLVREFFIFVLCPPGVRSFASERTDTIYQIVISFRCIWKKIWNIETRDILGEKKSLRMNLIFPSGSFL